MKDRMRCRFFNALQTIYFCTDRKYENDSERVFAESALRKLWEYDEITVRKKNLFISQKSIIQTLI